jgi:Tfp pilus assembly protein PilW
MPTHERPNSESGITLVEVLISSVLTVVLLTMAYGILNTTTKTATAITNRANNSTSARLAVDALETNLRFANGVWLCDPWPTTQLFSNGQPVATCPVLQTAAQQNQTQSPLSPSVLVSTDGSTSCSEWVFTGGSLVQLSLGPVSGGSVPSVSLATLPGVLPATYPDSATPGFTLSLPGTTTTTPPVAIAGRLVGIDLSVNEDPPASYTTTDTVTVHDAIAPNNLMTADDTTNTPCS